LSVGGGKTRDVLILRRRIDLGHPWFEWKGGETTAADLVRVR